jgi:glycosyltransferase involved in cell wall biosynthesis
MRVMLVAQWFPPIIGGEEGHALRLGQALTERGHEVSVVTLWQPGLAEREDVAGLRVHRIRGTIQRFEGLFYDEARKSAAPLPDPELVLAFRRIVRVERPDVVHAHNWLIHAFLPLKRWSHAPLVLTLHDFSLVCARKDFRYLGAANCSGPGVAKCLRCSARKYGIAKGLATYGGITAMAPFERASVDCFIAVSQSVADGNELARRDVRYTVIPNFIAPADPGATTPPAEVPGLPQEPFLLFVGAIARIKGVDVLLRAYAGLEGPPPLVLVGYPGEETELLLRDIPRGVVYLESLRHEAVLEVWRRSHIGIVPSVSRDSSPTVVLEAMAAGKPIVASRIGGIPDLIEDGVSGMLVEPGDVIALRDALARVLTEPGLAERLAAAARTRVRMFTAEAVVPQIEAVYLDLLGRRRQPN